MAQTYPENHLLSSMQLCPIIYVYFKHKSFLKNKNICKNIALPRTVSNTNYIQPLFQGLSDTPNKEDNPPEKILTQVPLK